MPNADDQNTFIGKLATRLTLKNTETCLNNVIMLDFVPGICNGLKISTTGLESRARVAGIILNLII